jgi:hypothetical protein
MVKEINRQFMEFKIFDTSTLEGMKEAVKFQSSNPEWKLATKSFSDFEWLFERNKTVKEIDGQIYSHELNKWVNVDEYKNNDL